MELFLVAAALAVGGLLAVQAAANLQLSTAVGSPVGASALQLGIAAALLVGLATLAGTLATVELLPDAEPWHLLGGLGSALYITAGILLFPRLGALASVGLFVAGQMFASLALDLFGLLGVSRQPVGPALLAGAAAVMAGVVAIIWAQSPGPAGQGQPAAASARFGRIPWIALGVLAGAGLPLQGAVNAELRDDLDAPITAGAISFTVATLAIAGVLLILLALRRTPRPRSGPLRRMPWWGWLGGFCAAAYVTATFTLIPVIGAATTIALTVTGQQVASSAIDHYGLLRLPKRPLAAARIAGMGLLIAGSALIELG